MVKEKEGAAYSKALAQLTGTLFPPPPSLTARFLHSHYLTVHTCFEGLWRIKHCAMGFPDNTEFNPQDFLVQMVEEMNVYPHLGLREARRWR